MTALDWKPPPGNGRKYSLHALDYSVCKVGSAAGTTFECWIGREQRKIGLASGTEARAWCQRHYNHRLKQEHPTDADAITA